MAIAFGVNPLGDPAVRLLGRFAGAAGADRMDGFEPQVRVCLV